MSTPISQLPIGQNQGGSNMNMMPPQQMNQMQLTVNPPQNHMNPMQTPQDNQLVDDILREMEDPNGQDSNINSESLNYTMDQSQIPPEQVPMEELPQVGGGGYDSLNMSQYVDDKSNLTFKQRILEYVRQPAIVFAICVILTVPQFNRILARFIPRLLHESGHFNMYGILFKGLLGAIFFFAANYFSK